MDNLEKKQHNQSTLNNGLDKGNDVVVQYRTTNENALGRQVNSQSISEHIKGIVAQAFAKVKK